MKVLPSFKFSWVYGFNMDILQHGLGVVDGRHSLTIVATQKVSMNLIHSFVNGLVGVVIDHRQPVPIVPLFVPKCLFQLVGCLLFRLQQFFIDKLSSIFNCSGQVETGESKHYLGHPADEVQVLQKLAHGLVLIKFRHYDILQGFVDCLDNGLVSSSQVDLNADTVITIAQVLPFLLLFVLPVPAVNLMQIGHQLNETVADLPHLRLELRVRVHDLVLYYFHEQHLVLYGFVLCYYEIFKGVLIFSFIEPYYQAFLKLLEDGAQLSRDRPVHKCGQSLETMQASESRLVPHGLHVDRFQLGQGHFFYSWHFCQDLQHHLYVLGLNVQMGNLFRLHRCLLQAFYFGPKFYGLQSGLMQTFQVINLRNSLVHFAFVFGEAGLHQFGNLLERFIQFPILGRNHFNTGVRTEDSEQPFRGQIANVFHFAQQLGLEFVGAELTRVPTMRCQSFSGRVDYEVNFVLGQVLQVLILYYFLVYIFHHRLEVVHPPYALSIIIRSHIYCHIDTMDLRTTKQTIKDLAATASKKQNNMLFQVHKENQALITFNRPQIMNAFSFDMYFSFVDFITKANQMHEIKYIILKGAEGNFSSGNDLNNFMLQELASMDPKAVAKTMADILQSLTEAIMKSEKPIFALVEGRTVGFAFTQLALYDKVFAAQTSSFVAPLVKIAQGPQMASSYLFPKIFGQSLAEDIIIKAKQMGPRELEKYNFLSCHKDVGEAERALQEHIEALQKLDWPSYLEARKLMRLGDKQAILKANRLECANLVERWMNPELPMLMMKYLANKKQKPSL